MKRFVLIIGILLGSAIASAQWDLGTGGGGDLPRNDVVTTSISATAIGTCADATTLFDFNGVIFCGSRDTTDPSDGYINGPDCDEHDGTCTAADLNICGGSDTKQLTSVNGTNCDGTDTVTVTCDGTANTLTHGGDFTCGGTDAACATAIAAAIDALDCASASAVGTTVGVQPADTTCSVTLAVSDGTCATVSNGTDGVTNVYGSVVFANDISGEVNLTFGATGKDTTLTLENDSGVTLDMSSSGSLNPVVRLPGAGRVKTPADGGLLFGLSGVDGRMSIVTGDEGDYTNYEASGTIDPLDGFVDIVGGLTVSEGRSIGTILIDCDDDQYTLPATAEVVIADTDVGSCTGNLDILLPAATCSPSTQSACRIVRVKNIGATISVNVEPNGSEDIDKGGAGSPLVLAADASVTLIDANQAEYHWIIE